MAKRQRQVGGKKEAPLAVVGSSDSDVVQQSPKKEVYTPEDTEYQAYSELLKGFFDKLFRWQGIAKAAEHKISDVKQGFDVFSIPNGLYIAPTRDAPDFMYDPPNRILHVIDKTDLDDPELSIAGVFQETFTICPGSEGKQLFVNPDGVPIREVTIEVSNQRPIQSLEIQTKLPPTSQSQRNTYRHVSYDFREKNDILAERSPLFLENNLRIVRAYSLYDAMTDAYATHLFNTIDGLIPGAPAPHQSGRRPTPELIRAPRQLPAPRRTPTRRT